MIWWIQAIFYMIEMFFAVLMLQVGMTLLNVPVPHGWREHLVYFFGVISIMSAVSVGSTVRRFIEVTILKCVLGKDEVNKFLKR